MSDTAMIFNVIAKDRASEVFGRIGASAKKFYAALLASSAGAVIGLTKLGESFEDSYNRIRRGTGATGEALEGLEKDFRAVMSQSGASMEKISTVMVDLAKRTGLTGVPLQELTRQFLRLGKVTNTDVTESIGTMTRVFGAWNIKVEDQAKTLDEMYRATQQTGVGISQLGQQIVTFGPALQGMGFTFEQSLALLGRFEQAGVNTGRVMMGMNSGLGKLAKAGLDPVKAFAELQDKILHAKTAAEATAIGVQMFGNRAGPQLANAIRAGKLEIADLTAAIAGGSDTIKTAASETMTFHDKLNALKNKGFVALEPVAMKTVEILSDGATKLQEFGAWVQRNTAWIKPLAIAAAALGAAVITINVAMKIWLGLMKIWTVITKIATAVQWLWNIALNANPIGLIIIAIVALVAGIYLLWTHSAAFRNFFIGLWNHIWGFLKAVGAWFAGPFAGFFVKGYHMVVDGVQDLWKRWKTGFNMIVDFVTGLPGRISKAAHGMWDGIKDAFRSVINWVIDKWNGLEFKIPSVSFLGQKIGGFTLGVPDIPKLDTGGLITHTGLAVVHQGETVIPARATAPGGGQIQVTVAFAGNTDSAFAVAFQKALNSGLITIDSKWVRG